MGMVVRVGGAQQAVASLLSLWGVSRQARLGLQLSKASLMLPRPCPISARLVPKLQTKSTKVLQAH